MANGADEMDGARAAERVEWPTVAVAAAIVGGLLATVVAHDRLPGAATVLVLGVLVAWYGSLRHEVVHGHPTPWRSLNTLLVALPLGLTEPFWHYRDVHVRHHDTDDLTDPILDPESHYLCRSAWRVAHPIVRRIRIANTTLAGRMVLGPWFVTVTVGRHLVRMWRDGERRWSIGRFVVADIALLVAVWSTGLPVWQYVLGAGYLAMSLTLVRSYAEHRAVADGSRTAVVMSRGFWALLFLNNNLHVTHHRHPGLAWYRIPAAHAASDADEVAGRGAGLYRGYGEVFRRYFVRPLCPVVDPLERERTAVAM